MFVKSKDIFVPDEAAVGKKGSINKTTVKVARVVAWYINPTIYVVFALAYFIIGPLYRQFPHMNIPEIKKFISRPDMQIKTIESTQVSHEAEDEGSGEHDHDDITSRRSWKSWSRDCNKRLIPVNIHYVQ